MADHEQEHTRIDVLAAAGALIALLAFLATIAF